MNDFPKMVYRAKPDCADMPDPDSVYAQWKLGKIDYVVVNEGEDIPEGFADMADLVAVVDPVADKPKRGRPRKDA